MKSGTSSPLQIGQQVAARWNDGTFWAARVLDVEGGRVEVLWEDGERGSADRADVIPLVADPAVKEGDRVLACWSGRARMWPGVVEARMSVSARVKWEDGSEPTEVPLDRMVPAPPKYNEPSRASSVPRPDPKLQRAKYAPGERVAAMWAGNSWWLATVRGQNNDLYAVAYDDGTEGAVSANEMVPVLSTANIKVGDRVLACWKGPQMYPGTVVDVKKGVYTVKWDDGSTPSEVKGGRITRF